MTDKYHDFDGKEVSLLKLIRSEPEWAENVIRSLKKKLEILEMDLETFSSNSLKAMEIKDKDIAKLQNEIERLQEGLECHLARPGESTYECNPNKPCPACRLRVAEERVKELETNSQWSEEKQKRFVDDAIRSGTSQIINIDEHKKKQQLKQIKDSLRKSGLLYKKGADND